MEETDHRHVSWTDIDNQMDDEDTDLGIGYDENLCKRVMTLVSSGSISKAAAAIEEEGNKKRSRHKRFYIAWLQIILFKLLENHLMNTSSQSNIQLELLEVRIGKSSHRASTRL